MNSDSVEAKVDKILRKFALHNEMGIPEAKAALDKYYAQKYLALLEANAEPAHLTHSNMADVRANKVIQAIPLERVRKLFNV